MSNYQKTISYLDYLENGMKIRNAGFVRKQENDTQMRLEVRMKNLPDIYNGEFKLHADCGGVIGRISLNRGSGSCCIVREKGCSDGMQEVKAGGIYLRLPERRLVQTVWSEPMTLMVEPETQPMTLMTGSKSETKRLMVEPETQLQEETDEKQMANTPPALPADTLDQQGPPVRPSGPFERSAVPMMQSDGMGALQPAENQPPENRPLRLPEMQRQPSMENGERYLPETEPLQRLEQTESSILADKWEQLTQMYPQIHPFGDNRVYLSISPKDFVVLCRQYHKMAQNSFLLHGFYNYHHLLLGRMRNGEEWDYYLGVPGNFYTREKMVAEMFGFEAFEGEKDPASPGDFGYYMKRVDI